MISFIVKDAKQPRAAVRSKLKAMERLPRLQVSFLHQIFGFRAIADETRGGAKQFVEMRQRRRLKVFHPDARTRLSGRCATRLELDY